MKTFRYFGILVCILLLSVTLTAQDGGEPTSQVQTFVDAFDRVDDVGKMEVVQSTIEVPVAELEPFYGKVIKYVVDNSTKVMTNTQIREMALLSLPRIREGGFTSMNDWLWTLFIEIDETFWRIELLKTMAVVGPGDAQLAVDLSDWMDGQNISKQAGTRPDFQVVLEATRALVALGDPVVYPVLVETVLAQYSSEISAVAMAGISSYEERVQVLSNLVVESQPDMKRELFSMYMSRSELTDDMEEIAFNVLSHVLLERPNNVEERIVLDGVRMDAVRILVRNPKTEYASALIGHFNAAIQSYDRGTADKGLVLEAIAALGETDSVDAAVRLAQFLDLINTYTEGDRQYDRQITLAVINNLKNLGKVEAYQALYMVTILNYSNGIQAAAREALAALSQ